MVDLTSIASSIGAALADKRVLLMPDFFVDRFIPVDGLDPFIDQVTGVHGRGGGNVPSRDQRVRIGGDAANSAFALARLGARVRLVAQADAVGRGLLDAVLGPLGVDLGGVKESQRSAGTVALEFSDGANVMLSDAGPLATFGPGEMTEEDWAWVESADAILIGNWSQTYSEGTRLIQAVVERAAKGGAFTMIDTSDPTHRPEQEAAALVADPSPLEGLSCWALNEVEALHFGRLAAGRKPADLVEAGQAIAARFGGRVDVHTGDHSVSIDGDQVTTRGVVRSVKPRWRTGAGDAWNAGNLAGTLMGLPAGHRLGLANAVAGCLLSSEDHVPPDPAGLARWAQQNPDPPTTTATNK